MTHAADLLVKADSSEFTAWSVLKHRDGEQADLSPVIREYFGGKNIDYQLNWLLLSTSGIHGTYTSLDGIEQGDEDDEDDGNEGDGDDSGGSNDSGGGNDGTFVVTVLIVKPRVVQMIYGNARFRRSEIPWLRGVVHQTLLAVVAGQIGNVPIVESERWVAAQWEGDA